METEAYLGAQDDACHAVAGLTPRTAPLFGAPGTAYVYLIYGMHWCLNVVTGDEGFGAAVLIRAARTMEGIDHARARRPGRPPMCCGARWRSSRRWSRPAQSGSSVARRRPR